MERPLPHPYSRTVERTTRAKLGAAALLVASLSAYSVTLPAQTRDTTHSVPSSTRSAHDWAAIAVTNQIELLDHPHPVLEYRVHTVNSKSDRLREVMECVGGSVSRLLAVDGKPLTPEQDKAERDRLTDLANNQADFDHHSKEDASSRKLARDLISVMPDAMLYTFAREDSSTRNAAGDPLVAIDFTPNPAWHPPSTSAEALTGLRGRVWINQNSGFVERMEGEVFRPVNFGFGFIAHIFPGGHLSFEQVDAGHHNYIYSHYRQQLRVRALVLKTIDFNMALDTSNYQTVPDPLSYQDAIKQLLR